VRERRYDDKGGRVRDVGGGGQDGFRVRRSAPHRGAQRVDMPVNVRPHLEHDRVAVRSGNVKLEASVAHVKHRYEHFDRVVAGGLSSWARESEGGESVSERGWGVQTCAPCRGARPLRAGRKSDGDQHPAACGQRWDRALYGATQCMGGSYGCYV
jgi:hypothetical protein